MPSPVSLEPFAIVSVGGLAERGAIGRRTTT